MLTFDPAVLPVPPAPSADDPAACTQHVVPAPHLASSPERPCTEEDESETAAYQYDATGRVVYRGVHTDYGYDATYTSEDDGGVRIEMLVERGHTSTKDVTQLKDGKPVEADHYFSAAADRDLVLASHSTWLYDAQGRQQYMILQQPGMALFVERNIYDTKGRMYFVDSSVYWPGATVVANQRYTVRSWFANGALAHEFETCGIVGGAPCGIREKRWEPCGNLAYDGNQTGNGRWSSFTDWSWGPDGTLLATHSRWNTTTDFFNTTESYQVGNAGRVISGAIVTTSPPGWSWPPTERHETSYTYDDAGRLIERSVDGKAEFHARFDSAGKLVELTDGGRTYRWTYGVCGG